MKTDSGQLKQVDLLLLLLLIWLAQEFVVLLSEF